MLDVLLTCLIDMSISLSLKLFKPKKGVLRIGHADRKNLFLCLFTTYKMLWNLLTKLHCQTKIHHVSLWDWQLPKRVFETLSLEEAPNPCSSQWCSGYGEMCSLRTTVQHLWRTSTTSRPTPQTIAVFSFKRFCL